MRLCALPGKGFVIFGHWRRGAVTACGLGTEDPVYFLEREGLRGAGGWEVVDCGRPVTVQSVYDLLLG